VTKKPFVEYATFTIAHPCFVCSPSWLCFLLLCLTRTCEAHLHNRCCIVKGSSLIVIACRNFLTGRPTYIPSAMRYSVVCCIEIHPTFPEKQSSHPAYFTPVFFFGHSSTLMMEATCSSETWHDSADLHLVIAQKTDLFIPVALRKADLTYACVCILR
jgi:hypothetical protein